MSDDLASLLSMDVLGFHVDPKWDIVLIKRPKEIDDDTFKEGLVEIKKDLHLLGLSNVVFGVEDLDDLMILSVADMNSIGWYNEDQILMLKKDMPKFNQAEEEE